MNSGIKPTRPKPNSSANRRTALLAAAEVHAGWETEPASIIRDAEVYLAWLDAGGDEA